MLEKSIVAAGGFRVVAEALGWRLTYTRKPLGYWSDIGNVRREVLGFIKEGGFEPGTMPARRDFERGGRCGAKRTCNHITKQHFRGPLPACCLHVRCLRGPV